MREIKRLHVVRENAQADFELSLRSLTYHFQQVDRLEVDIINPSLNSDSGCFTAVVMAYRKRRWWHRIVKRSASHGNANSDARKHGYYERG